MKRYDVYVASCTPTGGIYHYRMEDNAVTLADITRMDRPMYMVTENDKMYIVLRAPFNNRESGVVTYEIDDTGKLTAPSPIQSTKGEVACHIMVKEGSIYCANYISGSLIKLPDQVVQHSGHGSSPARQEGPHVHFAGMTPDQQYICAADLGLDTIFLYKRDMTLHSLAKVPSGHGVRHLAFSEDGKWLFAVNELKSTVAAFAYRSGEPELIDVCSSVPSSYAGATAASAIRVKDGYIYVSNRGHDSIAKMSFRDNKLALVDMIASGGKTPRDFLFVDQYLLCANQDSGCLSVLDGNRGFVIGDQLEVEMPVCVCVREKEER
ncbi:MAG: lactonase family protein [Lachnospiraceae bacterium]|nr:lactonase family protein [Lachnospiraceae bacterium]